MLFLFSCGKKSTTAPVSEETNLVDSVIVVPVDGITEIIKEEELPAYFELSFKDNNTDRIGYSYKGDRSVDGLKTIVYVDNHPENSTIEIQSEEDTIVVDEIYDMPLEYVWSKNSDFVIIHFFEAYSNGGSTSLIVVNTNTGNKGELKNDAMMYHKSVGKRAKKNFYELEWVGEGSFEFKSSITYLGESGHPGIDASRLEELGVNYNNYEDSLELNDWIVSIEGFENDSTLIVEEFILNDSTRSQLLLGDWKSTDDTSSSIEFIDGQMVSKYYYADSLSRDSKPYQLVNQCEESKTEGDALDIIFSDGMCWYIIVLNESYLEMSMVGGRGNSLRYKRQQE